jgi:VanZ family protein
LSRLAFWCGAVAVLYLALAPHQAADPLGWDKANHAAAFLALGLCGAAGWPAEFEAVLIELLAYGAAIELLQALTPTRTGDLRDLLADAVGLAFAFGLVHAARWLRTVRVRA